jgi:tyrosyl-tRNA synthetase
MADEDVTKYLLQFSLRSHEDLAASIEAHTAEPGKRAAQRELALEMTSLVHGADAARHAEAAAEVLFGADPVGASLAAIETVAAEVPRTGCTRAELADCFALLVRCGLVASTSEARRTLQQKGLRANGVVLEDPKDLGNIGLLHSRWILVRKGKTTYHLLDLAG